MKINVSELSDVVKKASIGGGIDEVVLSKTGTFACVDESRAICIVRKTPISNFSLKSDIGIYNLGAFQKAVQYAKDTIFKADVIDVEIDSNKLVMEKDGNKVDFLLSDPSMIFSNVSSKAGGLVEKVRATPAIVLDVSEDLIKQIATAYSIVASEIISLAISKTKTICLVGDTKKHSIQIPLPFSKDTKKDVESFAISFKASLFVKLLDLFSKGVQLEVRQGVPVVVDCDDYTVLLSPLSGE